MLSITRLPAEIRSLTASEIHTWLTSPRRERLPVSGTMWRTAGLAERFGVAVSEQIYGTLLAAGLPAMAASLASGGLDTGDPQWCEYVDALVAKNDDLAPYAEELRDLGYDTRSQWRVVGYTDEPTLADVEAMVALRDVRAAQAAMYASLQDLTATALSAAFRVQADGGAADDMKAAFLSELEPDA